ncbi:hypothetical protein SHKM778_80680 [Streptomyces sp. KM77-8]|uniref:Pentapeptide repeat-containing protein n=1 Tax=Streptomyces haneummycinicus TaxID=3074435 RepID=A0AAT9HVR7_9ACTN
MRQVSGKDVAAASGLPAGRAATRLREWVRGGGEGGIDLIGLDLGGADLSGGVFHESWFTDARLAGARLVGVDLYRSDAEGADFSGADLTRASLVRVSFDEAVFRGRFSTAPTWSKRRCTGSTPRPPRFGGPVSWVPH